MEYKVTASTISIYYRNQDKLFKELYPEWNTNKALDFEKKYNTLTLLLDESNNLNLKDQVIYIKTYAGLIVDSLTNVNFERFDIGKCDAGLKNSFVHNGKFYPMQESQSIILE
jgi:hypothetical protein